LPSPTVARPSRRSIAGTGGRHRLYGFLTTDPNVLLKPVHEKAMPVVLTTPAEVDQWLHAPMEEALTLQKPAAEDGLELVPAETS